MKIINVADKKTSIVFLVTSVVITILTYLSPIFTNLPKYVYMNIIGLIIFALNFSFSFSFIYVIIIQYLLYKFGLRLDFFNYGLVLMLVNIIIIEATKRKIKKRRIINKTVRLVFTLIAFFILGSFLAKIISLEILSFIKAHEIYKINELMNLSFFIEQFKIYGFSCIASLTIIETINIIKRRIKNEKVS